MAPSVDEQAVNGRDVNAVGRGRLGVFLRYLVFSLFLIAVGWAATKFDWHAIREQIGNASVAHLCGMVAACAVALLIRPLKLLLLLRGTFPEAHPTYWPAFRADNIAMAVNSVVPARAGEVAMAVALRQSFGISTASSGSVVLIDRFLDFCTVVLIFVVSFLMSPEGIPWVRQATGGVVLITLAFISCLILAVRLRHVWMSLLAGVFARLDPTRAAKWDARVRDLFSVLSVIDDTPRLVGLLVLSGAFWAMISLAYWLGIHAVWPDITPTAAAFTASAVALSFLLPVAPGGIGLFQGTVILSLQLFGVGTSAALAFGILGHALQVCTTLALAAISMAWQGMSLRTLVSIRATERQPSEK